MDLASAHPAGVQRQHLVVEARKPRLPFLDERRLKRTVAVPRNLDLDLAVVGPEPLGGLAVARVVTRGIAALTLVVAEVLAHLGFERGLDQPLGDLLHQALLAE